MSAAERLTTYGVFDDAVIDAVDRVKWQDGQDFRMLADWYGLGDGPQRYQAEDSMRSLEYFHIEPTGDHNPHHARVLHAPMATSVNESMAMRAMRLFEADPSEQLVVIGNPGVPGRASGNIALRDIPRVWNGDLAPANKVGLKLLNDLRITVVDHIGYSYGADKAANATALSPLYAQAVRRQVLMEPASTVDRGLLRLMKDFSDSGAELDTYAAANQSPPLREARQLANTGHLRRAAGLLRLSNIAIAHALSTDSFGHRLESSIQTYPRASTTVFWGTRSELAHPDRMEAIIKDLNEAYATVDLKGIAVPGMHHPGGDDISLHAAMVLQGLGYGDTGMRSHSATA